MVEEWIRQGGTADPREAPPNDTYFLVFYENDPNVDVDGTVFAVRHVNNHPYRVSRVMVWDVSNGRTLQHDQQPASETTIQLPQGQRFALNENKWMYSFRFL